MSAYSRVADIIEVILHSVAQEAGKFQDHLSVETESVITRGILEAFKRGEEFAHNRDTEPPPPPEKSSLTPPGTPISSRSLSPAGTPIPRKTTPPKTRKPTLPYGNLPSQTPVFRLDDDENEDKD